MVRYRRINLEIRAIKVDIEVLICNKSDFSLKIEQINKKINIEIIRINLTLIIIEKGILIIIEEMIRDQNIMIIKDTIINSSFEIV